ncbi:MAG: hypothetical protein HF967_08675 [Methanosarcinales archaeon]|nr:hypothetical protein [Methanosarcinales archaeon]
MREKIQKLKKKLEFTTTKKLTEATFDISSIKRVPIGSIIEVDCSGKALCPFHNDSTPSLYIYKEDNRFHCFSCGANGDVIDLYMELNNCNFYNACKALTI